MRRLLMLCLLLLLPATPLVAQEKEPDYPAELAALQEEYEDAYAEYRAAARNRKPDESGQVPAIDMTRTPTDDFLPRFQALAERAKGTDTELRALCWVLDHAAWARVKGEGPSPVEKALEAVLARHTRSAGVERVAAMLDQCAYVLGRDQTENAIHRLIDESPFADVQAAATLSLARLLWDDGDADEEDRKAARAFFEKVLADYEDTLYAEEAAGYVFEQDHLQIGMEAPDFEAVDVAGERFKLSDYRGQVTVVLFWGFW